MKGDFFMNNEKNRENWINMIRENLELGGRSIITIRNYTYAITHFLNCYSIKKDISKFNEKQIIDFLKKNYLNQGAKETTYNFNLAAIKYFYEIFFRVTLSDRLLPKA